jgi:hypothetical protein
MATKTVYRPVRVKVSTKVEAWDTRFGASARLVTRDTEGKFITNVSLTK